MRDVWKLVAVIGAAAALTVGAVHGFIGSSPPGDAQARIRAWLGVGLPARAEQEVQQLVEDDPGDVGAHYLWITLHYSRSKFAYRSHRDDGPIEDYYGRMAGSNDRHVADIGTYGLGLIASAGHQDCGTALLRFGAVGEATLPYVNNSIGWCLRQLGREAEATPYFEREIALGGNVNGASLNLAQNLIAMGRLDRLAELAGADSGFRSRLPSGILRRIAVWRGDVASYLSLVVTGRVGSVTARGLLAAVLILVVWFVFLRGLDVFEPERLHALLITLAMGMLSALLCTLPYDLVHFGLGFSPKGTTLNDLLYCVLVVGVIEEGVKLLPVLVVMRWTAWADEPVDIAIYAATSALGFAFVENLLYFDPMGLAQMHGRAFTATVLHMSLTTIAAYGLLLARGRREKPSSLLPLVVPWFALAVVLHGVYDFWLVGAGWVEIVRPLALLTLLVAVVAFRNAVTNGLSWSPFWDDGSNRKVLVRWWALGLALSVIVLVEYCLLATQFGASAADVGFAQAAFSSWLLIVVLTTQLGAFRVDRHRWLPLFDRRRARDTS